MSAIRVAIVEDHALVRAGLRTSLEAAQMDVHVINDDNKAGYESELDQLFRVRHRIYVDEKKWREPSDDGREIDQFDTEHAVHLVGIRGGRIVGTVQLGLDTPPNQHHRADVKKMLVHRSARGRGIGAALMAAIEEEARRRGRWLLVLDTVPGESGHRLYLRAGWQQSGTVPDYALFPDGRFCDTAIMWKRLA